MKGVCFMRGDGIRYAMEHANPELGQKIWDELMRPKPSMDKIREAKVRELKLKMIKAEREYEKASVQ
ncbi:MAG: hypothetical protein K5669_09490 [Lachnospiraceae bacterium]|nr:hypothetical protein [Lachnospiraceae bacterium]